MNKKVVLFVLVSSLLLLWMLSSLSIAFVKAVPEGIGVEEECLTKQDFADVASSCNRQYSSLREDSERICVTEAAASPADTVNVVFEEAHDPGEDSVANEYSEFADYLVAHGYAVSTIGPGTTIDSGVLAPVDVLVIVSPANSYLTSEIDAIETWVKGGGRLLLISEWGDWGLQASTIAARFGFTQPLDMILDSNENAAGNDKWPYYDGANLLPHPITAEVTRVEMYASDGITSAPADEIPLIVTDSDGTATWWIAGSSAYGVSVMSAIEGGTAGSGRLVIITDCNLWENVNTDGDGEINFYDSDHEILALNTVNWLAGAAVELYYDDGTAEQGWYWTGAGGMYAVRFTPPTSGQLIECSFYIYNRPATIKVHILDADKEDMITPFSEIPTSTGWFHVDLSTYGITVSQDVDFYVAMESTVANDPSLGDDTSAPDGRSWNYDGVEWLPYTDGDYMIRAVIETGVVEGHFWDAKIENLVDDDVDGYYEQIDLGWDADTDLAELTVFVKIYGRYEDGTSQFIIQDDPYTIYNYDVDWRYVTLTDGATGLWDFRLELYDYATGTLLDILDYEEDPDISNVPMDEVVEYVLTVQMPYRDVKVNVDGINYTTDADGKVQVIVSPGSCTVEVPTYISTGPSSREYFTQWSDGDQSNPRTVLVNSHLTLVAKYTTQYLVTFAQTGLDATATGTVVIVNGDTKIFSDLPYTTWVDSGDSISYSYSDPVSSSVEDKRFRLSDVTGPTSSITVTGPVTITGNYKTQYYLTMSTKFGTVSPGSGWYDAGSTVQIGASAPSVVDGERCVWLGWNGTGSGSYSGMDNPASITMDGPVTETAAWRHEYYLTVTSSYGSPTPESGWFEAGESITVSATSPVSGPTSTQYVCTGWTGTGSAPTSGTTTSVTFTIDEPSSITWNWKTQYYLTMSTDFGTVTPGSGWYDAGSTVQIGASAPDVVDGERYVWLGWAGTGDGNYAGMDNPATITMNSPVTETASWRHEYRLIMDTNFGTTNPSVGEHWYEAGSTADISATAPSATSDEQYVWDGWTGTGSGSYSGMDNPASITMDGPVTETATWIREYPLSSSYIPPLTFSAETIKIGKTITVSGSITPAHEATVTLTYTKPDGSTFNKTVTSSSDGTFSHTYKPDADGTWSVKASWSGDTDHYGDTSSIKEFTVVKPIPTLPWEVLQVILAVVGIVLTVTIVGAAWVGTHRKKGHIKELLDQIDDAFFRFQRNSRRCEAELYRLKDIVLEEYKGGTITEASYAVLNERIDDYLTKLS